MTDGEVDLGRVSDDFVGLTRKPTPLPFVRNLDGISKELLAAEIDDLREMLGYITDNANICADRLAAERDTARNDLSVLRKETRNLMETSRTLVYATQELLHNTEGLLKFTLNTGVVSTRELSPYIKENFSDIIAAHDNFYEEVPQ